MQIIENNPDGSIKNINVQECGRRVNAFLFLTMLNHYDPFVHEPPLWRGWQGMIISNALATLGQTEVKVPVLVNSSATASL